jgi:hypothetical protein
VFADTYMSFEGQRYRYHDVGVAPRPAQGRFTTWIGGNSKAAWRRVGRFGDGYIPMGNPVDQYGEIISTIRESAEASGRGDTRFDIGYRPPPGDASRKPRQGPHLGLNVARACGFDLDVRRRWRSLVWHRVGSVGVRRGQAALSRSRRSAIQTLMIDWRLTPKRRASRSSDSIIQTGKSTLTRRCS